MSLLLEMGIISLQDKVTLARKCLFETLVTQTIQQVQGGTFLDNDLCRSCPQQHTQLPNNSVVTGNIGIRP